MEKSEYQTPDWALDVISKVNKNRSTELNLSGSAVYRLSKIPPEIFDLTWLESLSLANNDLTDMPVSIGRLKNLRSLNLRDNRLTYIHSTLILFENLYSLDLSSNQVAKIPDTLSQLKNLKYLSLGSNKIAKIPDTLGQLERLDSLDLSSNQIAEIPSTLSQLKDLKYLRLGSNKIAKIPDTLGQLERLDSLVLSSNQITRIPDSLSKLHQLRNLNLNFNRLAVLPSWIVDLPRLERLYIDGNPLISPPVEVFERKNFYGVDHGVDIGKLQDYLRQLEEDGEASLYEAKLIVVGEPGAGKTSLTRKLMDSSAPLPNKTESTEGIDVHSWTFPLPDKQPSEIINTSDAEFRVNIWDFGGQEIYHATHQFFLTRRSLYIIVADAREQKTDFYHWLDLIEHLSNRSPVIIFNNEIQDRHWAINEQQLEAYFSESFQRPAAFNLAKDIGKLNELRKNIQTLITRLPHVGDVLPRTWVRVRRALENNKQATISLEAFLELCKEYGFSRIDDALQLSDYLHDLGVILHFQDDPLLKRTVILKPEWATDAVYRVLDNQFVKSNVGHFSRVDLKKIWNNVKSRLLHDELLALMMKFQLCYEIPGKEGTYIAPQLLTEKPPEYYWESENNLQLRYKYDVFMPKGIVTSFIVAMHHYIVDQRLMWRTGVILHKDKATAQVIEFYPHREIRIRVAGKNKRDLLTIVMYELDKLHVPFHRLKFDKLIPCNCSMCRNSDEPYFYKLDILKIRLEHGKTVIECDKPPFETVQIRPLLDDIGPVDQSTRLSEVLQRLNNAFSDDEFRTVCLEIGINYDNLSGKGLKGKQRELLLNLERRGRLFEFISFLRQKRPNINW